MLGPTALSLAAGLHIEPASAAVHPGWVCGPPQKKQKDSLLCCESAAGCDTTPPHPPQHHDTPSCPHRYVCRNNADAFGEAGQSEPFAVPPNANVEVDLIVDSWKKVGVGPGRCTWEGTWERVAGVVVADGATDCAKSVHLCYEPTAVTRRASPCCAAPYPVPCCEQVEDVTGDGGVVRKTLVQDEDSYRRPNEGAKVTIRWVD